MLYTAFTEEKRQTTCADSTFPLSWVRDSLILTLLGTPSSWCSTVSPHLWSRHCSPRHSSPITQSETWDSTALGHKYILLSLLTRNKGSVFNSLQPESRSGKTHQLSDLALVSVSLGGQRGDLTDGHPWADDLEQKEVKQQRRWRKLHLHFRFIGFVVSFFHA